MVEVPFPEPGYFFSYLDEENLFEWLLRVPVVSRIGDSDKELSIVLRTTEIDDQSAEEFVALAARYGLDAELPASMRKGRVASRKKKAGPESVILTDAPSNGFSLSLRPVFLSPLDERGFDDWLKRIQPRYAGLDESKTAILELGSDDVTVGNFHDLRAVFRRYDLNLAKLKPLRKISGYDQHWINWRKEVFGSQSSS